MEKNNFISKITLTLCFFNSVYSYQFFGCCFDNDDINQSVSKENDSKKAAFMRFLNNNDPEWQEIKKPDLKIITQIKRPSEESNNEETLSQNQKYFSDFEKRSPDSPYPFSQISQIGSSGDSSEGNILAEKKRLLSFFHQGYAIQEQENKYSKVFNSDNLVLEKDFGNEDSVKEKNGTTILGISEIVVQDRNQNPEESQDQITKVLLREFRKTAE